MGCNSNFIINTTEFAKFMILGKYLGMYICMYSTVSIYGVGWGGSENEKDVCALLWGRRKVGMQVQVLRFAANTQFGV